MSELPVAVTDSFDEIKKTYLSIKVLKKTRAYKDANDAKSSDSHREW